MKPKYHSVTAGLNSDGSPSIIAWHGKTFDSIPIQDGKGGTIRKVSPVDPRHLAALVTAARDAEKMLSGIFREMNLPGEWERGTGESIDTLRAALAPFTPDPAPPVSPAAMKTGEDIRRDFPGASVVTDGKPGLYTCRVTFPRPSGVGLEQVTGYGSTLASAEDTAWHGVAITLREDPAPPAPERKPYGYAWKTVAGYLASQGRQVWYESEPVGWAVFTESDHAANLGASFGIAGETVPVYRRD